MYYFTFFNVTKIFFLELIIYITGSGTSIFAIGGIDNETGYPLKDPKKFKEAFIDNDIVSVYFTEFINRGDGDGTWFTQP